MLKKTFHRLEVSQKLLLVFVTSLLVIGPLVYLIYFQAVKILEQQPLTTPSTESIQGLMPNKDPQTKEFYDIWFSTQVWTRENTGSGPLYLAETEINLSGPRLEPYTNLYGFKQSSESLYAPDDDQITFEFKNELSKRFTATVLLFSDNCIDLHSQSIPQQSNYIATICYHNSYIQPGNSGSYLRNPAANLLVYYTYTGENWTTAQFFSTAFNKYEVHNPEYLDGPYRTRVNWLTIDADNSTLSDFKDVRYSLQANTMGLTNQQIGDLCYTPSDNPQKYFKFAPGSKPTPEGGDNIPVTDSGGCNFYLDWHSLKPFFISVDIEGGIYNFLIPPASPSPSPTQSPTPPPVSTPPSTPPIPSPSTYPVCLDQITSFKLSDPCGTDSYNQLELNCLQIEPTALLTGCKTINQWLNEATDICHVHPCPDCQPGLSEFSVSNLCDYVTLDKFSNYSYTCIDPDLGSGSNASPSCQSINYWLNQANNQCKCPNL